MPRRNKTNAGGRVPGKLGPGIEFERIVAAVYRDFAGPALVKENDHILGRSGALRQVDISLRTFVVGSELLVIIECKDYARPVSQGKVDELIGKMEDVGAARAVLVSNSGFTTGAVKRAKADGRVEAVTVFDAEHGKLRYRINLPTLVEFNDLLYPFNVQFRLEPWSTSVRGAERGEFTRSPAPDLHRIAEDQISPVIRNFFEWCQQAIPELPTGTNAYQQVVFQAENQAVVCEITFEKLVRRYFNRDIYAQSRAVFNHTSHRLLVSPGFDRITIAEDEVVRSWVPVGPEFKAPKGTRVFTRDAVYKLDTAEEVARNLLRQFNGTT